MALLLLLAVLPACHDDGDGRHGTLLTPTGKALQTTLAVTEAEKTQGLSGKHPADFGREEAMLFVYGESGPRRFWMPDTHMNLDIFFLDADLAIVDVERDVPFHPNREEPIPRTRTVLARHVLEIRSDSALAKELNIGDRLKWNFPWPLQKTEAETRHRQ